MKKQFFPVLAAISFVAFSASLLAQPSPHSAPAPNGTPTPQPSSQPTETPAPTATPEPAPTPAPEPTKTPRGETRRAQLLAEKAVRVDAELFEGIELKPLSASFAVAVDGSATAQLLGSSGSRRVDAVVLNQIKTWRFRPALENGKVVSSTTKLRVIFAQN